MIYPSIGSVRWEIEKIIRQRDEATSRRAAVDKVDEWATCVIATYIYSRSFPNTPRAVIISASLESYFGCIGAKFDDPPEVMEWVSDCNRLMRDRLKWWADTAMRFQASSHF